LQCIDDRRWKGRWAAGLTSPGGSKSELREKRSIMSAITLPNGAQATCEDRASLPRGIIRRTFAAIIDARSASVERRIRIYLEGLSDERLQDLGFSAPDIRSVRAGAPLGDSSHMRIERTQRC